MQRRWEIFGNFLFPISYFLSLIMLLKPEHVNGKWDIGNWKSLEPWNLDKINLHPLTGSWMD